MGSAIGVPVGMGVLVLMVVIAAIGFAAAIVMRIGMGSAISMLMGMIVRMRMTMIIAIILATTRVMRMFMRLIVSMGVCMRMVVSSHVSLLQKPGLQRTMRSDTNIPKGWFLYIQYISVTIKPSVFMGMTATSVGMVMTFSTSTALFLAAAFIGLSVIGMMCTPAIVTMVASRHVFAVIDNRTMDMMGFIC